jgi:subtilisin-like proprotein convertase family protein
VNKGNKKKKKILKQVETEQHIAERPVGDWRNKGRNQKVPRI